MDPLDLMIEREQRDQITGAIRRLPDTERLVFGMVHIEGFSERDTASCTALDRKVVRQALGRATAMLRARLA